MNRNMATHPKSVYVLSFAEGWGRFNYYGTQMILVLYFTKVFLLSNSKSLAIYGAFASFSFALPILGGLIADKLLGSFRAIILGIIFSILANLLLSFSIFKLFCFGLGLNTFGTGLFKSSCANLIGALYHPEDIKRTRGYTIYYLSINIGATLGPIVYGLISAYYGWNYCFYVTALGLSLGLFFLILNKKYLLQAVLAPKEKLLTLNLIPGLSLKNFLYFILLLIGLLLGLPFLFPEIINPLLISFTILIFFIVLFITLKHPPAEKKRILAILILGLFGMLFFAASLQVGSSIILFINDNVHHYLFNWNIPTIMFTSLYPLAVIISAPFITVLWSKLEKRNLNPSTPLKLFYGLVLAALAFIVFSLAAAFAYPLYNHYYALGLIVLGNLFLGCGELVLTPAMFSAINILAPSTIKNSMVGLWFLFVAFGGYFSSVIANFSTQHISPNNLIENLNVFQHAFLSISLATLLLSFILLILVPLIKRLSDIKTF